VQLANWFWEQWQGRKHGHWNLLLRKTIILRMEVAIINMMTQRELGKNKISFSAKIFQVTQIII
jgi:hypothetical protein